MEMMAQLCLQRPESLVQSSATALGVHPGRDGEVAIHPSYRLHFQSMPAGKKTHPLPNFPR